MKLLMLLNINLFFFFFNYTATTKIYTSVHTLSLHDALPISPPGSWSALRARCTSRTSRAARSEEHTSELQSRTLISYAVFCLNKKKTKYNQLTTPPNKHQPPPHTHPLPP